jgi:hypothetical protein
MTPAGSTHMEILLGLLMLVVGVGTGVALAWLLLNGVMTVAFRR